MYLILIQSEKVDFIGLAQIFYKPMTKHEVSFHVSDSLNCNQTAVEKETLHTSNETVW